MTAAVATDPHAARRRQRAREILADAAYYGTGLNPQPSYCNQATCLAHRRDVYVNLQDWAWVHSDGFECDALAALTTQIRERRAARRAAAQAGKSTPVTKPCRRLTGREQRAIQLLQAMGENWPETLTVVSVDGRLAVVDTKRYADAIQRLDRRDTCILADIDGILSDGTGW